MEDKIRAILNKLDPIGVVKMGVLDEYDWYIPCIEEMLLHECEWKGLFNHLLDNVWEAMFPKEYFPWNTSIIMDVVALCNKLMELTK